MLVLVACKRLPQTAYLQIGSFFFFFPPQLSLHCLYGVYTFSHGLRSATNGVCHIEILQFQHTWLQGLLQWLCFRALKLQTRRKDGSIQQINIVHKNRKKEHDIQMEKRLTNQHPTIFKLTNQNWLFMRVFLWRENLFAAVFQWREILFPRVSNGGKVCVNTLVNSRKNFVNHWPLHQHRYRSRELTYEKNGAKAESFRWFLIMV